MPIDPNIPQCQHIKINGVRCGSPTLRGKDLCYFHNRVRARHVEPLCGRLSPQAKILSEAKEPYPKRENQCR